MNKISKLFLGSVVAMSMVGCGNNGGTEASTATGSNDKTKIALILPYIGDQSYFDTTYKGLEAVQEKYGDQVETKLIEMGTDAAGWDTAYRQAADDGYGIIISGNFQYESYMLAVAQEYPDIKFLNFDYSDAEANSLSNVYSITYAANEAGYLAGVVAGVKTESNVVGCVGGVDTPGIRQFLAGFMQGAYDVNPDVKVVSGFVGGFGDPATAKEIALNMNKQGADVIYHAAGGSGNGIFEAAAEENFWAIGVDSDQYASMSGKPELAARILTSSEKKCDEGILQSIKLMLDGTAEYGTQKTLGFVDGAVGLAENENYKANMTEEQLQKVEEMKTKLMNGEIKVNDQLKDDKAYDTWLEKVGLK
ncbi:MAG: BMP family ABC transporter substrate-binding protein [Erysipelotrichaceae bacterium]|nr:BMP family ABC transporter substrate-binding protein [Erysipelotrichaceae bacterium]